MRDGSGEGKGELCFANNLGEEDGGEGAGLADEEDEEEEEEEEKEEEEEALDDDDDGAAGGDGVGRGGTRGKAMGSPPALPCLKLDPRGRSPPKPPTPAP